MVQEAASIEVKRAFNFNVFIRGGSGDATAVPRTILSPAWSDYNGVGYVVGRII